MMMKKRTSLDRIVVIDEKYIFHRPIGTKKSNAQWVSPGGDQPTIAHRTHFDAKTWVIVAVTFSGKSCVQSLKKGDMVNSDTYIQFLRRMNHNFKRHVHPLDWKNTVLWHDNARVHTSRAVRDFLEDKGVTVVKQPPYSPDCNLLDRYIFSKLENERKHIHFESSDQVDQFVTGAVNSISIDSLHREYDRLKNHLDLVVRSKGVYL
jgi:transposase